MIFAKSQVLFRCAQEVHCEDFVSELTPKMYKETLETTQQSWYLHKYQRKFSPAAEDKWAETFDLWANMVQDYTFRRMTYATDILAALEGISQAFHGFCGWKTINGLIEDVMDYALLWRPVGPINRRFRRNGNPYKRQEADNVSELCLPTHAWCAWLDLVTYDPLCFEIRSFVKHFEIVRCKERKRRLVRYSQGPDLPTTDEPWLLQFQARCLRLVLSTAIAPPGDHAQRNEDHRRAWLLSYRDQKVGTAWYVPMMEQYHNSEVDAILLSKNKSGSASVDGWQFDKEVSVWDEWCLRNVMLIIRLPERGLSERLTISKIHEQSAEHAWEETIRLV
ncbi:MAG: hypothetical protein Q9194_006526 [Teloschistes cf. exilis]